MNISRQMINYLFTPILIVLMSVTKIAAKEYVIGVEDVPYYPLFDFQTNRDTFTREVLDLFAASKGYTFIYLPLPIKRFDKWLLEHKIDFKFPDNIRWYPDPEIREAYLFSDPVIKLVAGTTVLNSFLKKDKDSFSSLGTLLGFYPTTWIKKIESGQVALHEEVSTKLLVRKLVLGHLDGIDIEPSVINHYLKELNVNKSIATIDRRYRYDIYNFYFSTINHPKVIEEFNIFLAENSELIQDLKKKYKIIDPTPYERAPFRQQ